MKLFSLAGALSALILMVALLGPSNAQQENEGSQQGEASAQNSAGDVEHGRYLVHDVCLCIICHSPKDASGRIIDSRLLTGGKIPLSSPYPDGDWAFRAPNLRGLPAGWTEEELVRFLQTREAPRGLSVRLPMPPFHLNERDARAVAAYLKSLG